MGIDKAKNLIDNQRIRNTITGILAGIATLCGLCLAATALVPGFWELFFYENITETIQQALSHPVKIKYFQEYSPGFSPILPDIPPNKEYLDSPLCMSLPLGNTVVYSIVNISNKTIILSNELPIRIIDFQPYQQIANILVPLGHGGAGFFRNFVVDLPTTASVSQIRAVFDEFPVSEQAIEHLRDDEEVIDFFALTPREVEVFYLEVRFDGPGIYTFQPGIEYVENGDKIQVWAPESITAYIPENIAFWELSDSPGEGYVYVRKCWYSYPRDEGDNNFDKAYECDY